ncbi:hypothetical protein GCM10010498_08280 [Streptomyces cavourensis]|nr:hypothetical protein GCM10010498_08280 [Streptomyces cavourensis]
MGATAAYGTAYGTVEATRSTPPGVISSRRMTSTRRRTEKVDVRHPAAAAGRSTPPHPCELHNVGCSGADSWQVGRYAPGAPPAVPQCTRKSERRVRKGMFWVSSVEREM